MEELKVSGDSGRGPEPDIHVEPWLRGTLTSVQPMLRAVLHALELAREDAVRWTSDLSQAELEERSLGLPSVAFQMRHIARSLDRLLTYAEGQALTETQLQQLRSEHEPSQSADPLSSTYDDDLRIAGERVLSFRPEDFEEHRSVGRAHLPTTVAGLLVHAAEHTQRHAGQLVTTVKVLRALREAQQS